MSMASEMSRSERLDSLKRNDGFPFCAKPHRLFQHVPVRQIDAGFQDFAEAHFQPGHVEQRKTSRAVEIAHQVDIRLRRSLPARDRAEQGQPHDAGSLEFQFVLAKLGDDCGLVHSAIPLYILPHLNPAGKGPTTRYNCTEMDVYEELLRLRKLGQKCAIATIVQVRGSIPSYESAKLLVREDGSMIGTIGGGCVEAEVWNVAREVIEKEQPRHLSFNLGQDAAYDNGLICGGQLDVFVEPVLPVPCAFIFGAGHISKSISKVANLAGFSTIVVDDRENFANRDRFPEASEIYAEEYESVFAKLSVNENSYLIVVTRGHRDDMRVLGWAVSTNARYIAMIGSKRKVISVIRELEGQGIAAESFARVFAPMGLEIGAVSPEEIAVSVVAEMIAVRRNPESGWRALSKSVFADESLRALLLK